MLPAAADRPLELPQAGAEEGSAGLEAAVRKERMKERTPRVDFRRVAQQDVRLRRVRLRLKAKSGKNASGTLPTEFAALCDLFRNAEQRKLALGCEAEVRRTSVFVGTTNEDELLTDATGNRRYWPIRGCNRPINIDKLREWRDQLWAEAVQLYNQGEQWHLMDAEEQQLTDKLRDHERLDPWHGAIAEYVAGKTQVCTNEVLGSNCLNIARERQGRAEEMRVTSTLKLLGFRASRVGPKRERIWVRD